MTITTSFQKDIRPLFTDRDIKGMSPAFNLASYDDVKKHAAEIYDRIRAIGGAVMPPPPPSGWPTGSHPSRPAGSRSGFVPPASRRLGFAGSRARRSRPPFDFNSL